jgi:hypothetical protein
MGLKNPGIKKPASAPLSAQEKEQLLARARQANNERLQGYREQSLKIHPWVCARCGRHFTHKNLQLLTVHHKDHNHDNNPSDGSNWENLCVYCHDYEHGRYTDAMSDESLGDDTSVTMSHSPFAGLANLLKDKK